MAKGNFDDATSKEFSMQLDGKVAWITGGGAGIGRAASMRFAKEGAKVVVLELDQARGEAVVESIHRADGEAALVVGSATDEADVKRALDMAMKTYGGLDILVNNAYYCHGTHVLEIDSELWDRNIEGCLKSAYLCSRASLPQMIQRGGGSIVNISSVNAIMSFGESAYSAAKAGVISLTKTMAVDYGPEGVRVNAICPGTVITEGWQPVLEKDPQIFERIAEVYPLKRVGKPEEIANVALFLASDEASFVTGAVVVADGGVTSGNPAFLDHVEGKLS